MTEYAWFTNERGGQTFRRVDTSPAPKRSSLPSPMVITDTMDALQHPCTGEMVTSKSAFRALTKAHGCIEVGNDPARLRPRVRPKTDRKSIRDSLSKARARFSRGERVSPKTA